MGPRRFLLYPGAAQLEANLRSQVPDFSTTVPVRDGRPLMQVADLYLSIVVFRARKGRCVDIRSTLRLRRRLRHGCVVFLPVLHPQRDVIVVCLQPSRALDVRLVTADSSYSGYPAGTLGDPTWSDLTSTAFGH